MKFPFRPHSGVQMSLDAMADRRQVLERWGFPHIARYGVTLVNRVDADACLRRIYSDATFFHGYDAFHRFEDGSIQPHLQYSDQWTPAARPSLEALLGAVRSHPAEITHYEFVFGDDQP